MSLPDPADARFVVVPRRALSRRRGGLLALAWLASLVLVGALSAYWAGIRAAGDESNPELEAMRQQLATLARSDQISRAANLDLQSTLAERDEEIAALRADVQFYERLVGATGQRRGLGVHEAKFRPESGGSWRYEVILTQNLNRGGISRGGMRLAVDGVEAGRLRSIDWERLRQQDDAPAQPYSFRYFQRLEGSIVLPAGFTPQQVRVVLDGSSGRVEANLPWTIATPR